MSKLIERYLKVPSPENRKRIMAYMKKHPFAVCMLSDAERDFLFVHSFTDQ